MNITNDETFYIKYDEESDKLEYKTKRKFENKIVEYFRENKIVLFGTIICAGITIFQIYLTVQFFSLLGQIVK